jgi:hypothetical protein
MKNRRSKILLSLLAIVWLALPLLAGAQQNATGMDEIFILIGQDKPIDWADWTRDQRFQYMQDMGLYPPQDRNKYQGEINDLSGYFTWLGIEQPDNWLELSFAERKAIVAAAQKIEPELSDAEPMVTETTAATEQKKPGIGLKLWLIGIGTILGALIIFASYKIDRLRANKS